MELFLLSQNSRPARASQKTSMTHTRSQSASIFPSNVVSQRRTLEEIKASIRITYCECFGTNRRRGMAQAMNYQSGWH